MKRYKILVASLSFMLAATTLSAQSSLLKKADNAFNDQSYYISAKKYNRAIKKAGDNVAEKNEAIKKLANTYYQMGWYKKSCEQYEALFNSSAKTTAEDVINYAEVLRADEKYAEALTYYKKYKELKFSDTRSAKHLADAKYYQDLLERKIFKVSLASFNTENTEFSPVQYKDKLLFITDRKNSSIIKRYSNFNNKGFYDVFYMAEEPVDKVEVETKETAQVNTSYQNNYDEPQNIFEEIYASAVEYFDLGDEPKNNPLLVKTEPKVKEVKKNNEPVKTKTVVKVFKEINLNTKYHEGPLCFTKNEVFFTRNNYSLGSLNKGKKGFSNLNIYYKTKGEENEWSSDKEVSFINKDYSYCHPTFNTEGNVMYFSSDMPGGKGGMDIYSVTYENGKFGSPVNLGDKVNTEGDEVFGSFFKNVLYFSSNGHAGLGGLDLFRSSTNGTVFMDAENLGYPANSSKDDFGLMAKLGDEGLEGYFSSNRAEGYGEDDIYAWKEAFRALQALGTVVDAKTGKPIANCEVVLKDENGKEIKLKTDSKGAFKANSVLRKTNYTVTAAANNYYVSNAEFNTNVPDHQTEVKSTVKLVKDPKTEFLALITDAKSKKAVEGVSYTFTDNISGNAAENGKTNAKGTFLSKAKEGTKIGDRYSYNLKLTKEGYLSKTITINGSVDKEGTIKLHENVNLAMAKVAIGTDIGKLIDLKPIYYERNKATITKESEKELDKIVKFMNSNSKVVIELSSHTDSKGSGSYNLKLSDRRAKAAASYVKDKIITDAKRIYGKGYGEKKLLNKCKNGVKCSDEEHAQNRRTEFKIVKIK